MFGASPSSPTFGPKRSQGPNTVAALVWDPNSKDPTNYGFWQLLVSILYWALEPECEILVFMWSFEPLLSSNMPASRPFFLTVGMVPCIVGGC